MAATLGSGTVAATSDEHEADADAEDDGDAVPAAVRFAHLSPDTPAVDAYLGKPADLNPTVGGLQYPTLGPGPNDAYLQVPAGEYDVAVAPERTTEPAIEVQDLPLEAGSRYTLLAAGRLEAPADQPELQAIPLTDAESREDAMPSADQASVRFVHASPDAGQVDVTVDGDPFVEGVEFGDASGYSSVDPAEYDVGLEAGGAEVFSTTRSLPAGVSLTVYVVGLASGTEGALPEDDEHPGLGAVLSVDATHPLPEAVLTR